MAAPHPYCQNHYTMLAFPRAWFGEGSILMRVRAETVRDSGRIRLPRLPTGPPKALPRRRSVETSLYPPVKRYLENLGFAVKGEVCGCDVVGLRGDGIVVICELKLRFNLKLVLQGVDRSAASEEVWLAVRTTSRASSRERDPRVRKLCRLLGFGLLGISASGHVEAVVEPRAWRPRRDLKQRSKLVTEHQRRHGDPAVGGSTRSPIMTAYRQQALACAAMLRAGPRPTRDLRPAIPDAPKILLHNVYGWFVRTGRGIYDLTDAGRAALARWPQPAGLQSRAAAQP